MTCKAMIFLLLFLAPSLVFADSAERQYEKAKESYRKLLDSPRLQQRRDQWQQAIEQFAAVSAGYPRHRLAPAGLYQAGKAASGLFQVSRRLQDARQAANFFDALAESYPGDRLADDALVLAADIYLEHLDDPLQALRRYRQAAERRPAGDMAAEAKRKVDRLARFAPATTAIAQPAVAIGEGARRELTGIRFWSNPGYTRIVLDLSGPAAFTANLLAAEPGSDQGPRLYVDIGGTVPAAGVQESTQVGDGLLRQIRTGRPDGETVRVVLDLVSFEDYKVFHLEDPHRLVLDVTGASTPELTSERLSLSARPAGKDQPKGIEDSGPLVKKEASRAALPAPLRRIVVDPGHGGKDPGAIGPSGIREKDVTLAIGKVLARLLEKEFGCDVILTRNRDVYLPLEERTAIANRVGADLFISVHANAAPNREAFGIETYYLNFSKNEQAAAVAARENGTSLKKVGDLELILFDLMANSKINESSRLAAEVQRSLVEDLGRHYNQVKDLGVRQGPFYVLLGANMPSVLVEAAFISHPREEKRLKDAGFHQKTAAAIVRAVRNYIDAQRVIAWQ